MIGHGTFPICNVRVKLTQKRIQMEQLGCRSLLLGWGAVEAQWRCRCAQRINDLLKGSISNLPPFIWVRYHSSQLGVSQTQMNTIKVQEFQN